MVIVFKNVGQGDSIIIEWKDNDKKKIGIIDCNLYNSSNPVLHYLLHANYETIEFVLLTHPHYDHFSGLLSLFNWCLKENIRINSFLTTSEITPEYISTALKTVTAKTHLAKTFQLVRKMKEQLDMRVYIIDDNPEKIKNIEGWNLTFLSPSSDEKDMYLKNFKSFSREEEFHNNPAGNYLSTLIKIQKDDKCILLTADSERTVFNRLKRQNRITEKLILAQSPHHGSKKNHNQRFWETSRRKSKAPIAISVGENNYDHPSKFVLDKFEGLQFTIKRTDTRSKRLIYKSNYKVIECALDNISEVVKTSSEDKFHNDLIFEFI